MNRLLRAPCLLLLSFSIAALQAQTSPDIAVLKGLSAVSTLSKTGAGRAALAANYTVTGGIQNGDIAQPTLLPFAEQEQQALRDAFITSKNLAQLADGLGTTLGGAYNARFHYIDQSHVSAMPESLEGLIQYALSMSGAHSNAGKFFFANGTRDGKTAVSADEMGLITSAGGVTDPFGIGYGLPAGTPGANRFGNSRPFQTERSFRRFSGFDYFHIPADNTVYNSGPAMSLVDSPSYPSGHTTYGYTGAILLAVLVPERYSQMIVRGAEYGNDRILIGSHYAMDVLGGRTLAMYDMAHLLANDPQFHSATSAIPDFQAAVKNARAELSSILSTSCGTAVSVCATHDISRFSDPAADETFYHATQTYNLPVVHPQFAGVLEDVSKVAPEAGYLLTAAFPSLTLDQADRILTETEGPGGGFLDDGSPFGVYSRLDLYTAGKRAAQLALPSK